MALGSYLCAAPNQEKDASYLSRGESAHVHALVSPLRPLHDGYIQADGADAYSRSNWGQRRKLAHVSA